MISEERRSCLASWPFAIHSVIRKRELIYTLGLALLVALTSMHEDSRISLSNTV